MCKTSLTETLNSTIDELDEIVDKVKKLDDVVPSECKYLGIDQLADSSVNYLIQVKCSQGKQFAVKRAVLGIVKEAYDNNDIKIPYNQLEVHNGKDI